MKGFHMLREYYSLIRSIEREDVAALVAVAVFVVGVSMASSIAAAIVVATRGAQ